MECFHTCLTNGLMQLFNVYMLLFKSSLPLGSDPTALILNTSIWRSCSMATFEYLKLKAFKFFSIGKGANYLDGNLQGLNLSAAESILK